MNFDLKFYISRFMRRLHYFLLVAVALTGVSVTLAAVLPPVFRAQARLLVESPQIPGEMAASTVQTRAPEALQIIQQRLLTRANLLDMAQRLRIYEGRPALNPDDIVEDMRRRTEITLPNAASDAAFVSVSFAAQTGELSAQVTNDFVTLILQENVALRTATSSQTLAFFQQEVDRLGKDLAYQGGRILEFKLNNKEALPDSLEYRRTRQASQQERLLQIDREMASLNDRRTRLVALYERTGQIDGTGLPRTPEEEQLRRLREELSSALIIYSPQNPQVKVLQGKVAAMEEAVNQAARNATPGSDGMTAYELQLADIDGQIAFAAEQKQLIEAELVTLQETIDQTPSNAIALDSLQRDYDNVQLQYNEAVTRLAQAATGDRIEALAKGQRITVIEQAVVPRDPDSPNRPLIAAGGTFAGLALGLGLVLLIEMTNRTIHRPVDLTTGLGIAPFATVPFIRTRAEIFRRRALVTFAFLGVAIGIPGVLLMLHLYYLPLDLLIGRFLPSI
jgi:succinoglycan biosynthesis transport protein ExoP